MADKNVSGDGAETAPEAAAVQPPESAPDASYMLSPENGERVTVADWVAYRDGKVSEHPASADDSGPSTAESQGE